MVVYNDQRFTSLPPDYKLVYAVIYQARRDLKSHEHGTSAREFLEQVGLLDAVTDSTPTRHSTRNVVI